MEKHEDFLRRIAEERQRNHSTDFAMNTLKAADLRLLESIKANVLESSINIKEGNQKFFDLLETRFPIGFNRIDWSTVQPHKSIDLLSSQDRQVVRIEDELVALHNLREKLIKWFISEQISENEIVVGIGDSSDICLETTLSVFFECYPQLFTSGQHYYVMPHTCDWCLNYTLEGVLYFGWSANSLTTGHVNLDSLSD